MTPKPTLMRQEICEIPNAVDRLLTNGGPAVQQAVSLARETDPRFLLSVARGSSDHACTYLKYASEILLGLPMASVGPSVRSVYGADIAAEGGFCLAVSQSGQSPDIVSMTRSICASGAPTLAITNDPASPLAQVANVTLPIHAGPEVSVAATKTFVTSAVAGLWLLAEWKGDTELVAAINALPGHLAQATDCDWSVAADALSDSSVYMLGRGPSWAIANEAALKFKETCRIHAESYSSAEVQHGPVSIIAPDFPVIALAAGDAAEVSVADVADTLADKGARVFATTEHVARAIPLPHVRTDHWLTDPLSLVVSFYAMVEAVAVARGIDPDAPQRLKKVTETL